MEELRHDTINPWGIRRHDYDESVIKPETDEERAARLEAQRQTDAPKAL